MQFIDIIPIIPGKNNNQEQTFILINSIMTLTCETPSHNKNNRSLKFSHLIITCLYLVLGVKAVLGWYLLHSVIVSVIVELSYLECSIA